MNGVTSSEVRLCPPITRWQIILIIVGLLMLIGGGSGAKVLGVLVAGLGGFLIYANKATHVVVLHSASGEAKALTSKDATVISSVIEALNQSLIHRG